MNTKSQNKINIVVSGIEMKRVQKPKRTVRCTKCLTIYEFDDNEILDSAVFATGKASSFLKRIAKQAKCCQKPNYEWYF